MEGTTIYNEEEVQELFEVVFKLSAKDVDDKLKKVNNRPEIAKRRWFWELLQNAKDAVKPDEKVSVKLVIDSIDGRPYVEFQHNGNPFRYQDAKNLIFPYSDKGDEENSDKSGRFGTGFLATHILSMKIDVKGIYLKDDQALGFNFTLDRTGDNKPEIAKRISSTWQEFRKNRNELSNYVYDPNKFDTSFRYELSPESLLIASNSFTDFSTSLPYALSFIPKIKTVEIDNKIEATKILFRKKEERSLAENINEFEIEKITSNSKGTNTDKIKLIVCTDGTLDIAIEIFEENGKTFIKKFPDHQPLFFCPFPLIGANDFKFPAVVNSTSFIPKEERDGVWLDNAGYGLSNQPLLERVVQLYLLLGRYASSQNWKQTHLLLKSFNETLSIADFNPKWFNEKILSPLKKHAIQIPFVDLANGQRVALSSVYFPNELKEENRTKLWEFMKDIYPNNVTMKEEIQDWHEVLFEDCWKFTPNSFTKHIAKYKTLEALQSALGKSKDEALKWLDNYVSFINKVEPALLNASDSPILPNQYGIFKRKDELYLDDDTIDSELKEILSTISKFSKKVYDWRTDMLDKKIYLELPSNRTRTISLIGTAITEEIKDLLRNDSPTNELRDLFSRLYNWLIDNPQKAKDHFKGLKTDTLLYKCADEKTMGKFTEMFKLNRDGKLSVDEQIAVLSNPHMHLLKDPDLELKVTLGEQVLADAKQEREEFEFKKKTGNIFETLFQQIVDTDDRFTILKVEGEEDFIITNNSTGNKFYVELKSIRSDAQQIYMTHKQAKKANQYPSSYFLCIIPNNGSLIDESYFKANAKFDGMIGTKLSAKVRAALNFEAPEEGISVEFEDALLSYYTKYRYKFSINHTLWGQDDFTTFVSLLN